MDMEPTVVCSDALIVVRDGIVVQGTEVAFGDGFLWKTDGDALTLRMSTDAAAALQRRLSGWLGAQDPSGRPAALDRVKDAMAELLEVANLRGDNSLPHPSDDPILWTARMQDAWNEAQASLDDLSAIEKEGGNPK